jgi:CheY-like chemotaxis protein
MTRDTPRILLVEDHPFQLKATQYLLETFGFTQLITTDCAQGALLEMLRTEQPFDILLCDQCLPDMLGIDLVKFASQLGMIRKAILLSSLSSAELDSIKSSVDTRDIPLLGYLTKPLRQSDLLRLLNSTE